MTPAARFRPAGPRFRLLFGETRGAAETPEPPVAGGELFGWGVVYALHARACIERGRLWQAEHYVGAVRDHALSLACLREGRPAVQARGVSTTSPLTPLLANDDAHVRALSPDRFEGAPRRLAFMRSCTRAGRHVCGTPSRSVRRASLTSVRERSDRPSRPLARARPSAPEESQAQGQAAVHPPVRAGAVAARRSSASRLVSRLVAVGVELEDRWIRDLHDCLPRGWSNGGYLRRLLSRKQSGISYSAAWSDETMHHVLDSGGRRRLSSTARRWSRRTDLTPRPLAAGELERVFASYGVNGGEFDVLASLRRAGRPLSDTDRPVKC